MLTVITKIKVKKDKSEEVKSLANSFVSETLKDEGCKVFHVYQGTKKRLLFFLEIWENEAMLNAHKKSQYVSDFKKAIAPSLDKPAKMYLIEKIR